MRERERGKQTVITTMKQQLLCRAALFNVLYKYTGGFSWLTKTTKSPVSYQRRMNDEILPVLVKSIMEKILRNTLTAHTVSITILHSNGIEIEFRCVTFFHVTSTADAAAATDTISPQQ